MKDANVRSAEQLSDMEGERRRLSRRQLIGAGGVALTMGVAGCIATGPFRHTTLSVSIRESFEAESPVTVPLIVDVFVRNVNSKDVALRGVELAFYDTNRELLATHPLEDFSWRDADSQRREREEYETWLTTTTSYSASWSIEADVDVDAVPEWITYRLEEVWFGDDERSDSAASIVGTARATSPPPEFNATVKQYVLGRPPLPTIDPDDYRSYDVPRSSGLRTGIGVDEPLLPASRRVRRPDPIEFWHARVEEAQVQLETDIETFSEESKYNVAPSFVPDLRAKTLSALQRDGSDGPHVFEFDHTLVADYVERGFLSDLAAITPVAPENAFVELAAEAVSTDDEVIGVPYTADTVALLYNRELVEQPPRTVSELATIMDRHHDPDADEYGLSYPLDHPYYYSAWPHAFGGYYYDPESDSLGLTEPETLQGIEFVVDRLSPYVPDGTRSVTAFEDGNAPFAINGPRYASAAAQNGIDVGVTALPSPPDGTPKPYVTVEMMYVTNRVAGSDSKTATAAAASFATWFATNEDVLVRNARDHGSVPVYRGAIDREDLPETTDGFVRSIETGRLEPPRSKMEVVYPEVQTAFEAVLADERSVAAAFAEAERNISARLDP